MKLNEALSTVKSICDNIRCTKQERGVIDTALATIHEAVKAKPEPKT